MLCCLRSGVKSRRVPASRIETVLLKRGKQAFFDLRLVVGHFLWNAITFYHVLMVMMIVVVVISSSSSVLSIGVGIIVNALVNTKCSSCELVVSCLGRCWYSSI